MEGEIVLSRDRGMERVGEGEREIERSGVECRQKEREREMEVDREREKCNWMQTEKQSRGVK